MDQSYKLRGQEDYRTGRAVASLQAGIGWCSLVIGAILFLVGLAMLPSASSNNLRGAITIYSSISMIGLGFGSFFVGLFAVSQAQGTRATMDAAEYARKHLELQLAALSGTSDQADDTIVAPASTTQVPGSPASQSSADDIEYETTFRLGEWQVYKQKDGRFAINTADGLWAYESLEELKDAIKA